MSTPKPPTFCYACGQQLPQNPNLQAEPDPAQSTEAAHQPPHTIVQAHTAVILTPTQRKAAAIKQRAAKQ